MFEFVGETVAGGWNAVQNIISGTGRAMGQFTSGFFPSAQKTKPLTSQIAQPAATAGLPYRPTAPEAPSIAETAAWAENKWFGSPYQDVFSPNIASAPEASVFDPWKAAVEGVWGGATGVLTEINNQLPDILMQKLGLIPTPTAQNTQGDITYHIYNKPSPAADTTPADQQAQPPGMFSIAFPQWAKAPVVPIPGTDRAISSGTIIIAALIGLAAIFLSRK